jgi:hypothetical protein
MADDADRRPERVARLEVRRVRREDVVHDFGIGREHDVLTAEPIADDVAVGGDPAKLTAERIARVGEEVTENG